MSENHTPVPWHWDDTAIFAHGAVLARIPNHPENGVNWKNDAEHIVRAVNALPELIKALHWARPYIKQGWEGFGDPDREGAVLKQIDIALAAVGERP